MKTLSFLSLILLLSIGTSGCRVPVQKSQETLLNKPSKQVNSDSMEHMLALIDSPDKGDRDAIRIAETRFRYNLDLIQERTGYSKEKIGDMTVAVWVKMRDDYGKKVGLLEFMESARRSLITTNTKYEEVIAFMATYIISQ